MIWEMPWILNLLCSTTLCSAMNKFCSIKFNLSLLLSSIPNKFFLSHLKSWFFLSIHWFIWIYNSRVIRGNLPSFYPAQVQSFKLQQQNNNRITWRRSIADRVIIRTFVNFFSRPQFLHSPLRHVIVLISLTIGNEPEIEITSNMHKNCFVYKYVCMAACSILTR